MIVCLSQAGLKGVKAINQLKIWRSYATFLCCGSQYYENDTCFFNKQINRIVRFKYLYIAQGNYNSEQ